MRLKDKIALITGGGSGIGEATAILFAEERAKVAICDLNEGAGERVARAIMEKGGVAKPFVADVSIKGQVDELINNVLKEFGRLDILINNAGVNRDAMLKKMTEEDWDFVLDVNLKGTFLCSQAASLPMMEQKYGKINTTSSIGAMGNIGQSNYSASKAGIIGLTKTLALELARYNINVNCVAPGATHTPMTAKIPPDIAERFREMIPFKRFAQPREIAYAHLFLASDEASYITGQVLFVDGGITTGI